MKKLIAFLSILACTTVTLYAMIPDNDKNQKQFSTLWKQYDELDKADKPAQASKKLMEIRSLAQELDYAKDICESLTEKNLEVRSGGDSLAVYFQNLNGATVTLYRLVEGDKGPKVYSWKVKNDTGSFYLTDVRTLPLPENLDDGEYLIEAVKGKITASTYYRHFTLSLAWRKDAASSLFCASVLRRKTTASETRATRRTVRKESRASIFPALFS